MRKPKLKPEIAAELRRRGVDSVKALLAASSNGVAGVNRSTTIRLEKVVVTRGELEDWLRRKSAASDRWVKLGVLFAAIGALAAIVAAVEGWPAAK